LSNDNIVETALENFLNAQYIGSIYIGGKNSSADPQMFYDRVIFDTGSAVTWVQVKGCAAKETGYQNSFCTKRPETYDPSSSVFNKPMKYSDGNLRHQTLSYGIGYAEGKQYIDRVCLDK